MIETPPRIEVILVDDHPLVREGTRAALERSGHVEVIETAADGAAVPAERILGQVVDCDNFQDARKFLANGGEKGRDPRRGQPTDLARPCGTGPPPGS